MQDNEHGDATSDAERLAAWVAAVALALAGAAEVALGPKTPRHRLHVRFRTRRRSARRSSPRPPFGLGAPVAHQLPRARVRAVAGEHVRGAARRRRRRPAGPPLFLRTLTDGYAP